jgi:hypothetical protein
LVVETKPCAKAIGDAAVISVIASKMDRIALVSSLSVSRVNA